MTGRGRRATLPPGDHRAQPVLSHDGLIVNVVNKAGYGKAFDFATLSAPEPMQKSLAAAFAVQSRRWTSHRTAGMFWQKVKVFVAFLEDLDSPPEDLDQLTAAAMKRWRTRHISTNTGRLTLGVVRLLLQQDARVVDGPAAEEVARRVPGPRLPRPGKHSFDEAERERVVLAAQRDFRTALLRIRENTELLERWRAGLLTENTREWRLGQTLDHLARTGDVPRRTTPGGTVIAKNARLLGGRGPQHTWGRLFLNRKELTALAVLLSDRFGWNLSVYDWMPAPTRTPSVGEIRTVTYQVTVEKRRAGSGHWFSTENITDSGADSPGRLITQALEATAAGRHLAARLAPGTDLLMTGRTGQRGREFSNKDRPQPVDPLFFGVSDGEAKQWAKSHGLAGSPFRRTRRTTVTRERRPLQHAQGTHESVYVLPDEHVQKEAQGVIAEGALEALQQAQAAVFGGLLIEAAEPDHQETATADCADDLTSPWPAPDGGCGANFLLCLACPNARVHPGHHPRLAHLHQQLRSLRSVLPGHLWDRWHEPLLRLEHLQRKIGSTAWNAALSRVTDRDRTLINLLLKGELAQ